MKKLLSYTLLTLTLICMSLQGYVRNDLTDLQDKELSEFLSPDSKMQIKGFSSLQELKEYLKTQPLEKIKRQLPDSDGINFKVYKEDPYIFFSKNTVVHVPHMLVKRPRVYYRMAEKDILSSDGQRVLYDKGTLIRDYEGETDQYSRILDSAESKELEKQPTTNAVLWQIYRAKNQSR